MIAGLASLLLSDKLKEDIITAANKYSQSGAFVIKNVHGKDRCTQA